MLSGIQNHNHYWAYYFHWQIYLLSTKLNLL